METLLFLALLLASLYAISRGADLFIDSGSGLGYKVGLKEYLIGSLIVGVGTSLPEMITSVSAVIAEQPVLVAPNVFGTVSANILAGLGLSAMALFVMVNRSSKNGQGGGNLTLDFAGARPLDVAVPIAISSALLSLLLCADGVFSRIDSFLFLGCYLVFLFSEFRKVEKGTGTASSGDGESRVRELPKKSAYGDPSGFTDIVFDRRYRGVIFSHFFLLIVFVAIELGMASISESLGFRAIIIVVSFAAVSLLDVLFARRWMHSHPDMAFEDLKESKLVQSSYLFLILYLVFSLAIVFTSGDLIVASVLFISEKFGLGATVLTASIVALGTSIPDILVAIKIARRGLHQMLIGHIVQSNVFDMLLIMALCGFIVPLPIDTQTIQLTIPCAIGAHFMLLVILQDQKISAAEGSFLFVGYLAYMGVLYGVI